MQQSSFKNCVMGFTATLIFQKVKVTLNPLLQLLLNFVKSSILTWLLLFNNKEWGRRTRF